MRIDSTAGEILRFGMLSLLTFPLSAQAPPVRWQATYTTIYSENVPATASTLGSSLQLQNGASIVGDPTLMLPGTASIRLKNYATVNTNPAIVPIAGNATYIVEFKYRILSYGTATIVVPVYLIPAGDTNQQHLIPVANMAPSAPATGTFSAGGQTGNAAQYYFSINASADSDVVIDDIRVIRQDAVSQSTPPSTWAAIEKLPFPRLGKGLAGATGWQVGRPGMLPYQYSVDQIESRLAFNDVIAELDVDTQTREDPGSIRRLRQLNPNAVILPYHMEEEQGSVIPPLLGEVSLQYAFLQSIPDEWYAKDTAGNYSVEDQFPDNRLMNISPFGAVVNGQTFLPFMLGWLNEKVFPSGLWDGVFFDNFFGEANIHIRNLANPALLNIDYNRNGVRDETPASISDMTRSVNIGLLQQFRATTGDLELLIGNAGSYPELNMAPYMNGSFHECFSDSWNRSDPSQDSPASWRAIFDAYRAMQAIARRPRINILEGCGSPTRRFDDSGYASPTLDDLRAHRLALGTTLLSDGFYSFDLRAAFTAPLWYDEYSVDAQGRAVEDRTQKGYLGAALTDAIELADAGSPVLQGSFGGGAIPSPFRATPVNAVSVSNGVLILTSADHTQNNSVGVNTDPNRLKLDPGTYLLTFDWKILETLDHPFGFNVSGSTGWLDSFGISQTVAGDFGTVHFPITISTADAWSIGIYISGAGKLAIDNVRVTKGGVGPWRRDFENGFVLVNPFPTPHTFSAADLAGTLGRTNIKRINGTQAPGINNGQPATGGLTLAAFDGIILLADRIAVGTPSISAVNAAGGFPDITQNGWIEIKGSNLAPAGAGPIGTRWDKAPAFDSGIMPDELNSVRVMVNGKPAFVFFVSSNQVNVLSPLDDTTGPVQIVVTSGGLFSAPFIANLRHAAPSLPLIGSTNYVVATHADYSLVGPASLSSPGYTFTPARAGETIVLYAFGLGLPSTPLVNGASSQSGLLPTMPQVQIGGATAAVTFAGVISPGLYQLNTTIPLNTASGDNKLVLMYNGQGSPSGDLITVQ